MGNVDAVWEGLIHQYNQKAHPIPFDFKNIVLEDFGEKR